MANELLKKAAETSPRSTKRGWMERLFTFFFQGFVYNQIWEDPDVDIKAMRIGPETRIITIASGGCNILNYLAVGPKSITAVDLNPAHLALGKLKIAAVRHLPDYAHLHRFFAEANDAANVPEVDQVHWKIMIQFKNGKILRAIFFRQFDDC